MTRPIRPLPGPRALLAVLGALGLALLISWLGITATGETGPRTLVAASPLVTWGLPALTLTHHLGLLVTIGAGGAVVLLLPGQTATHGADDHAGHRDRRRRVTRLDGPRRPVLRLGGAGAALWALSSLLLVPLQALEAAGAGGEGLWQLGLDSELGRIRLSIAVLAALAGACMALGRSTVAAAWGLAFAGLGAASLGLAGHAGSNLEHINAVNAMAIHLLAVSVWAGGLLVLALMSRVIGEDLPIAVRRFSPWALASVLALAASGTISASTRLQSLTDLWSTPYGMLILGKAVLLVALALIGFAQRRALGDALRFRHLALTEGMLMAVVIGVSVALGRSAPPRVQVIPPEGALLRISLVGFDLPQQPFGLIPLFTQFHPDWGAILIAATMAGFYLAGVVRLRRRGDTWSLARTLPWLAGCAVLVWVMSGGPGVYGKFRFDAHMVQHMAMMMIVPPLWVLGAPITLLTRAAAPRTDGSRGLREWVLAALDSRYAKVVSSPPMAGLLFAGSLVVFYFTPLFELSMRHHVGHVLMTVHFLLAGYLFAWVMIGVDPAKHQINPMLKMMTLLITLSFHAFFGVAVVSSVFLIAQQWYLDLGLYTVDQLELMQRRGGSIMWGVSEVPTVLYAIILAVQWISSDERRARQWDRKADRDGEAELEAYNRYLEGLRGRED